MTMPTFTDGVLAHAASFNAMSTGINNLSTYALGAVPPRAYVPTVRLQRTNAQTFTTGTNTPVQWDTVNVNNDNMFTLSSPTVINIQTAGSYALDVEFGWSTSSAGDRVMWGTKNGTSTTANSVCTDEQHGAALITGRGNTMHIATVMPNCVVGDTFFVLCFQNSGGSLTNVVAPFQPFSSLSMWRIGP